MDSSDKLTKLDLLISNYEGHLGAKERKLASYIRENQDVINSKSIADIANESGISKPSVTRFFKKLGFDGMKDFKINFSSGTLSNKEMTDPIGWEDESETVVNKMFSHVITSIEMSFKNANAEELEEIASHLASAFAIDVFGIGGSALLANFFRTEFMRLGLRTNSYSDIYTIQQFAQSFVENECVVFISRSGETVPLVNIAKKAKDDGAYVIVITTNVSSTLSKLADKAVISSETDIFNRDQNSMPSQIVFINTLYYLTTLKLAKANKELKESYFEKTNYKKLSW